jgi:DNA-binding MarR family transcriptional regulator
MPHMPMIAGVQSSRGYYSLWMPSTEEAHRVRHDSAIVLLAHTGRLALRGLVRATQPTGVKPRHAAVLLQLRDRGALTQQALCAALHLDPSVLVAVLNDLEQEGFATRTRDPADRRRHIVELSKRGAKRLAAVDESVAIVEQELFEGLSEAERGELAALLARVESAATDRKFYAAKDDVDIEFEA